MDSDKLDRDFEHEGTAYTGKLRKQEGGGGWMFMAFKDNRPFGPAVPNIEANSADAAMDQAIDGFITVMKEQEGSALRLKQTLDSVHGLTSERRGPRC